MVVAVALGFLGMAWVIFCIIIIPLLGVVLKVKDAVNSKRSPIQDHIHCDNIVNGKGGN